MDPQEAPAAIPALLFAREQNPLQIPKIQSEPPILRSIWAGAMEILIWIGAAISVAGMAGLIYCIARVARAKRAGLDDDALRAEVGKVVPLNLGALFLSVIGLMVVVLGIFFG